jgi:tetratricopeptide (TPR) repeat protein
VLAADGELYEQKVYESLTDVSQLSTKPMFMPDLQARIKQYCKDALKNTLVLCIDKGFDPDLTLRLTAECLRALDIEEDAEYFLMVTAKLKNINHMTYFFTTLRDLRPSLLKGLLVELSQDREQYQQTVQLLRCIRYTDIKNCGESLSEYFIRESKRLLIDTDAFICYSDIILHKLTFEQQDCFRVFYKADYQKTTIKDLALIYNNLGGLFYSKGDLEQAAEFYMKCLEIWEAVLPSNHPDLATIYNNLGSLFGGKGDFEQAIEYIFKGLEIREAVLPRNHPDLATIYNNLGIQFKSKGDMEQAADFYMKCLEIREAVLPSNHPDLGSIYNNLGTLYQSKGDWEQAAEFYMECLEIEKRFELHPLHALVYESLGDLFLSIGVLDDSEVYLLECLRIRKLFCSIFHVDRERIFKKLVLLYRAKGDLAKAEFYWRYPE